MEYKMTDTAIEPVEDAAVEKMSAILEQFVETASVEAVYGPPIQHGETLVVPAAEVLCAMGFGMGSGSGTDENQQGGGGGGGGGGGRVLSRPVAAIIIEKDQVRVEPVVDVTKIALGLFTTIGFIASMAWKMNRNRLRL
jgi:uncharacterized spore protein YtfJ